MLPARIRNALLHKRDYYHEIKLSCYNEVFRIYGDRNVPSDITLKTIIVEDSNAGYQFYRDMPDKKYTCVISANGKSNIAQKMKVSEK